jgi:archaellin
MKSTISLGITIIAAVILFFLIATTASSIIDPNSDDITEEDIEKMIKESVDDIASYINIDEILAKYEIIDQYRQIKKISIQITPLFTKQINIEDMIIELNDGNQIITQYFKYNYGNLRDYTLFNQPIWDNLNESSFSICSILDKDESINKYNSLNDHTDRAYLLIKIPNDMMIQKGDNLKISIYPSTGVIKTLSLNIPFSIDPIVNVL